MEIKGGETIKFATQMYPQQAPPKNLKQYRADKTEDEKILEENLKKEKKENIEAEMLCPQCKMKGNPIAKKKLGLAAWTMVFILCCFCFPFCFIPLISHPCKDTYNYCRYCGVLISVKPP